MKRALTCLLCIGVAVSSVWLVCGCGKDRRRRRARSRPASKSTSPSIPKLPRARRVAPPTTRSKKLTIAVVPTGTEHAYWQSLHAGAGEAAKKLDVSLIWKGPAKAYDIAGQISIIEDMIARGVDGIVLAPLHKKALQPTVQKAARAGIPVVVIDTPLGGKDHVSFVATNDLLGGQLAGKHLATLLGGKGRVALLRFHQGIASTSERERGFLDAIRAYKGMVVVADPYAGPTVESALQMGENLLQRFAVSGGVVAIDGIFCSAEPVGTGMLVAIRQSGLTGKVRFVTFGRSRKLIDGLKKGRINALLVSDPARIGHLGVETIVRHLNGRKIPKLIDVGVKLVTKDGLAKDASLRKLVGAE